VSYFVLVGRRGLRIGDKVQISGVSGEVTDIGWLQFQIKEIDTRTQQPTGNVVTFSNSIVLAAPSTGLSKFNPRHLKAPELEVAAKAAQS
jgi:small-conductance mechanosensitive channel